MSAGCGYHQGVTELSFVLHLEGDFPCLVGPRLEIDPELVDMNLC